MNALLSYLLQVIVCSGILYAYYHFFLRNKKFHRYNRYYLLLSVASSIIIPLFKIPVYFSQQNSTSWKNALYTITGEDALIRTDISPTFFTWENILMTAYALILFIFLSRFLFSLVKINRIIKHNPVENIDDIRFINTEEQGTPFSFFNWLFWNKKIELNSDKGQQIFRHELFHIRHKHSWDVVFMELLTVLLWINPFYHIIKKELKAIHEFLADQYAIETIDKWDYAELLLMQALQTKHSLVNPFFHTQIKRRIAMLTSSKQPKYRYLRKILVLPLFAMILALFAFTYKKVKEENQPKENTRFSENGAFTDTIPSEKNIIVIASSANIDGKGEKITLTGDSLRVIQQPKGSSPVEQPLYVIDGKIIKGKNALNEIAPNEIESIAIFKDAKAISKYGKDGSNGVIEITTKKDVQIKEVKLDDPHQSNLNEVVVTGYLSKKSSNAADKTAIIEVPLKPTSPEEVTVQGYPLDNSKIFEKLGEEARFPGGNEVWIKYLQRNLNGSIASDRGAPPGNYQVMVQFIVHTDGSISNIKALTNHGYGMEEEVMRIIKAGPKWEPGKQNGKSVASYRRQPVTFQVVTDDFPNKDQIDAVNVQMIDAITSSPKAIYPNPTSGEAVIPYESKSAVSGEIVIADIKGNILSRQGVGLKAGKNLLKINVGSLSSGNYIISVAEKGIKTIKGYKLVKQ